MMKICVFNPEHDLALAANLSNFTAPHAGRQLRADLGYIPAIWAGDGDYVLVDNVEDAERCYRNLMRQPFDRFLTKEMLHRYAFTSADVWGWDRAIRAFLLRNGVSASAMPSNDEIDVIRDLSHRKEAVDLLSHLQMPGTTGCSYVVECHQGVVRKCDEFGRVVVKAPWSSSGRGVRFIEDQLNSYHEGWIRNIIDRQGCVIVEPYYNKVKDFGMEFESDGMGQVRYLGLSLFQTKNGAYTGNVIASEDVKYEMLSRYIPVDLLRSIQQIVCNYLGPHYDHRYKGCFGVDMMIVCRGDGCGFLLHPCVEINLRRTMGHTALSIPLYADGFTRVMRIELTDKYRLKIGL